MSGNETFAQNKVDQHKFHHWLVISKLVTISLGQTQMTTDHFKQAIELENERVDRVNEIKAK